MRKTLIITDVCFWASGAGHISRISKLVDFIATCSAITVVYLGPKPYYNVKHLLPQNVDMIFLHNKNKADRASARAYVGDLLTRVKYKLCIIEYIHNSDFLKCIPDEVVTVLDVHDIISDRTQSFRAYNYDNWDYDLSREKEYKIFSLYDYVMFISKKDYEKSLPMLDHDQMIVAPHPPGIFAHDFREGPRIVGFVASDYAPNVDAINWFLEDVWPVIPDNLNLSLHIYGIVHRKIPRHLAGMKNVYLKGFQKDLTELYSAVDIAINPVRFGAGLKIKNMEALANGIPLITSSHGASGIEQGIDSAFLVADTVSEYVDVLTKLVRNSNYRKQLAENGQQLVKMHFGAEECFKDLKGILLG